MNLSCDELIKVMNGLMHEIHTRDVDFTKNKFGFNYGSSGYKRHLHYYRYVQELLGLARQAYENNGCDLIDSQARAVDFYETKAPDPLGHPGKKPHKSLFQQMVDRATIRIPRIGFPIPVPVGVA